MSFEDARCALLSLAGEWDGEGVGEFPTIEDFRYREYLIVEVSGDTRVAYRQHTWRIHERGEVSSHTETGYIGIADPRTVELTAAHGLDRVETMKGIFKYTTDSVVLRLDSSGYLGDDRMISSWREWRWTDKHLHYDMSMATRSVPTGAHHLTADLYRRPA